MKSYIALALLLLACSPDDGATDAPPVTAGTGGSAGAQSGSGGAAGQAGVSGLGGAAGSAQGAGAGGSAGSGGEVAGQGGKAGSGGAPSAGAGGTGGGPAGMAGAGGVVCNPQPEVCNGKDDNCDGVVDNLQDVGEPCGSKVGACKQGILQCIPGDGLVCVGAVGPSEETCNNIDDDCDELTDDFEDFGQCQTGNVGICAEGHLRCALDGLHCEPVHFISVEILYNGLDDDCDGETDEGSLPAPDCTVGDYKATCGTCKSCEVCAKCGGAPGNHKCKQTCRAQSDCLSGFVCTRENISEKPDDYVCDDDPYVLGMTPAGEAPPSGLICQSNVASSGLCSAPCMSNTDCPATLPHCKPQAPFPGAICTKLPLRDPDLGGTTSPGHRQVHRGPGRVDGVTCDDRIGYRADACAGADRGLDARE